MNENKMKRTGTERTHDIGMFYVGSTATAADDNDDGDDD